MRTESRIYVAGHGGLVGSAIVRRLEREGFSNLLAATMEQLDLRRPIYRKTAAFGHFGRTDPDFTWERLDRVAALNSDAGL